jgi:hypothetical protein
MMRKLPTVEECREFLAAVNRGREALGLLALEHVDFDDAMPGDKAACLSARSVFRAAGCYVGSCEVTPMWRESAFEEALTAVGCVKLKNEKYESWWIPRSVKVVTNPFDHQTPGLRERMVEAGVVKP